MARGDAGNMRDFLRRALAETLAPAGWVPATPVRESRHVVAQFVRPLENDIAATAAIGLASRTPDRLPVQIIDVEVGVCYEPLRRLWPLLGERYELALRSDSVWPEEPPGDVPSDDDPGLSVSNATDADGAVATLAGVIGREAVPFAEQYASLDRLLAEFGYIEGQSSGGQTALALLAAAGRLDEARTGLTRYDPPDSGHPLSDRDARRFVHQLERYIDSGGDPSLVPREPPPADFETAEMRSASEIWRESRAKTDAVRAVRDLSPETERAALRAALERELASRGLSESPLWFEQTLDHLHDSRAEQARFLAKGAGAAAGLAFRAIRGLREHRDLPDLTPPAWLDPPGRAAYPVPRNAQARWAEVEVDEPAEPYLSRAYDAIPRLFGSTAMLSAWLAWDQGPDGRVVVSLGNQRVGTVAPAAYRFVMDRAAERDELPYVPARLTARPPGHLLEIQLPDRRS